MAKQAAKPAASTPKERAAAEDKERTVGGPAQGKREGKAGSHKKALTGRQKAAVFLVTLGSEIASEIFKHLREDEIEQLTFEIARLESIVEILNMVDRSTEKTIVESLEEDDPELAEEIKKRMFVFEDIVLLDDRAIQKVMREVDTAELAKALKSVDSEVQDKIYRNMSKRASTLLKEDMDYMGPIRLKDVEEAQQRIVAIIRKLEEQGEIVVARAGEEELVV